MQPIKQSKQLRYYYRHHKARLDYQAKYYQQHKSIILTNKQQRDESNKVKRTTKTIRLLWDIYCEAHSQKRLMTPKHVIKAFLHKHGRPKRRYYNVRKRGKIRFHMIPQFSFQIEEGLKPKVHVVYNYPKSKALITARQLSIQTAHFLGLNLGDSFTWKEKNLYSGRIETHTVCFDRSGLDLSHIQPRENDIAKLVEHRLETGLKGLDLLSSFALKYSVENYIRAWRGNQVLITDNPEAIVRDYYKQFPLCKT